MYQNIAVATDNSEDARFAEALAVRFAREFHSGLTGYHIYSGRFHKRRFQALEQYLPSQYQTEKVLEYQRKIHSTLIERGLEIISSEYMKGLREACGKEGIPLREVIEDGKRSDLLSNATAGQDLFVLGARGIGRIPGVTGLGSTSERVLRLSSCDLLVARTGSFPERILVGIDGSEASFSALGRALAIGTVFQSELLLAAVHNPDLHRSVFDLLSGVLSQEAGSVFRFKEQEDLHTRVIDQSLADFYRRHLEKGAAQAEDQGLQVRTRVDTGVPWHALCRGAEESGCQLVVVGRYGMHRGAIDTIGSNAFRIADRAGSNVLIVGGAGISRPVETYPVPVEFPAGDRPELVWTPEARERIGKVPSFARPMAVLGVERYAREHDLQTITPGVLDEVRKRSGL